MGWAGGWLWLTGYQRMTFRFQADQQSHKWVVFPVVWGVIARMSPRKIKRSIDPGQNRPGGFATNKTDSELHIGLQTRQSNLSEILDCLQ